MLEERVAVIAIPGSISVAPSTASNEFEVVVPQFSMMTAQPEMRLATTKVVMQDLASTGAAKDLNIASINSDEAGPTEGAEDLSTKSINFDEVGTPIVHLPLPPQTYRDVATYSLVYDAAAWEDHRQEPKDPRPFS